MNDNSYLYIYTMASTKLLDDNRFYSNTNNNDI